MTDKPTDEALENLFVEETGFDPDDFPAAIFGFTRAALTKWGQPAQAGEPFCWHWENTFNGGTGTVKKNPETLGINMVHPDHKWTALYTAPQPTHAQAGAVPLDEARRLFDAGWKAAALLCDREDVVADGIIGFGACPQFEAAFSAAHGPADGESK